MNIKVLTGLWVIVFLAVIYAVTSQTTILGGPGVVSWTASSTQYALGQTSLRLVATSSRRVALSIQPTACPTTGSGVFLELTGPDTAAVTTTADFVIFASTSAMFTDNDVQPAINSIQGIVNSGTCTVVVTEWRTAF